MQALTTYSEPTAKTSGAQLFMQELKRLYSSTFTHIFVIVYYHFALFCFLSIWADAKHLFLPLGEIFDFLKAAKPWGPLVIVNLIAAIIAITAVCIGNLILQRSICKDRFGTGCKVGLMMIVVSKFNQNILTLFSACILCFKAIIDISPLIPEEINDSSAMWFAVLLIGLMALIVLFTAFIIFLSFKTVITVTVMKESIENRSPVTKQYLFTATGYFILTGIAAAAQILLGFNLTYTLGCVSAVLFGVHCIRFRNTMRRIAANS